jgi:large subunit ribosomal protein L10Ae
MSKISSEFLKKSIVEMLEQKKTRKFLESVELQIVLREYDLEKDQKFNGSVKLPNQIYPSLKVLSQAM